MLAAAACTGGSGDVGDAAVGPPASSGDRVVDPAGELLAEVPGVGAVYAGTVPEPAGLAVRTADVDLGTVERPAGVMSVGSGLHVDLTGDPPTGGRFEVHLALPADPEEGAIPAALHVGDDGTVTVQPGVYDPGTNEIVVWTTEFSDWFGGWWNPANWAEEVIQAGQGAWDAVADWMTGRTDPPPCRNDAPAWSALATAELASVHTCLQANPAGDGTERVELFLKSNRNTAQLVTLPPNVDYVWVEGQPDWLRPALVEGFNVGGLDAVDGDTHVLLLGGQSMSVGFRRPAIDTSVDMLAYRSWVLVIVNPVLGLLGRLQGSDAEAVVLAVQACVHNVAGLDVSHLDVTPTGYSSRQAFVGAMAKCTFELLQEPGLAIAGFDEILTGAGLSATDRNRVLGRVRNGLDRLEGTAHRLAGAFDIGATVTDAWDNVFDTLAEGRVTVSLTGAAPPPSQASVVADGDGIGGVQLDTPAGDLIDRLTAALGPPGQDTGFVINECLPDAGVRNRWVGWSSLVVVLFDDPDAGPLLRAWYVASVDEGGGVPTGVELRPDVSLGMTWGELASRGAEWTGSLWLLEGLHGSLGADLEVAVPPDDSVVTALGAGSTSIGGC